MNHNKRYLGIGLLFFFGLGILTAQTIVSIHGDQFYINGKPTYKGRYWNGNKIEGLLMNSRMVQGVFDDLNPGTANTFAYPDTKEWDAERNNKEFVAAMLEWYSYGLNCFTINMQGGSPTGYQYTPCTNPGFHMDGSLREPYMQRLDRILKRADELQMVVILGFFYFGQDQYLSDEKAIVNATVNMIDWLFEKGYRNVLIEISNETHFGGSYDHDILLPDRIHELINMVKEKEMNGYRYLVGTSFGGLKIPTSNVVEASDFLLIHGNGAKDPEQIQQLADETRRVKGYRLMPVINNEDDHFDFDKERNNYTVSIENYISWGYLDFRFPGETAYVEGYQSVPVDWGINSERKKAFFNKVAEITGGHDPSNTGAGSEVRNPILPGFYPDPSICMVDDDYYLVNSSFSYFPGVPIFHSTDLVHWKQIGHILDRPSQLMLKDHWISGGIYAPALRYHEGTYYMITTLIGSNGGNFFVTAKNPAGPWSDPVWLKDIEGIDPSFFFDEGGKTYIINNGPPPENKPMYNGHRALWLQTFDLQAQKLTGERKIIVNGGTDILEKPIWIEGPHLFRKNAYYYLLAAEGGTGPGHSAVIFRSKSIWGPYEVFDGNPILTQRDLPDGRSNPVTCAGHADMVQTPGGDWVSVFLACQPYSENYFNTGRQTFFLPVDWSGEWPVILEKGKAIPGVTNSPLKVEEGKVTFAEHSSNWKDEFDHPKLKLEWNFIRTPNEKWHEIKDDALIIQARPAGINEVGNPSFIGRRQQHARAQFSTVIRMEKGKEMEAGIVAFQNEEYFYKLVVRQENGHTFLSLASASAEFASTKLQPFAEDSKIYLKMKVLESKLYCEYSLDGNKWNRTGGELDARQLSTSVAKGYVGSYFGLYAFARTPAKASFDWASYQQVE